ncbi:FtsX-like permease family protein [Collinsella sp. An268]|uniref:FtsX-like permease family protein n=1 Tax=Collinsella sp. An268 TaxID=1965612 RepID=UPI000B3A0727|nr:FtsX-like permease family protein [Collinsella sp. An268]OUO64227.1 ABC transporter permease [Collinsella sp. An268]
MNAFTKDIVRTIRHTKKRFISIAAITALGATMLTGLSMACLDLREAADALYARQNLFDISVQSTYGLTQDDVDELAAIDGVSAAEGGYEQEAYTRVDGSRATVSVKALLDSSINEPYVSEGRLPEGEGEVAVTENYLHATGKQVGDTLTFESSPQDDPTGLSDIGDTASGDTAEDDSSSDGATDPTIPSGTYTIVGSVIDPTNITQPEGPVAFRAATSSDYTFFVSRDAVSDDAAFTIAYLRVSGAEGLSAYSEEYEARVDEVQDRVEELAPQRERARADELKADALDTIAESEADAEQQLADAERELDDAQATLDESLAEALDGQAELDRQEADALTQLNDAQAVIDTNRTSLAEGLAQLEQGRADLEAGITAYNAALPAAKQKLEDGQAQLDAAREDFYNTTIADLEAKRNEAQAVVDTLPAQIDEMDNGVTQLADGLTQLADGLEQIEASSGTDDGTTGSGSDSDVSTMLTGLTAQLRGEATSISTAWDAVKTVDSPETAAADQAAQAFVQAVSEANTVIEQAEPEIAGALNTKTQQVEAGITKAEADLAPLDQLLQTLADDIDATQSELDEVNAKLETIPADDPARTELEAKRTELTEALVQKRAEQTSTQQQRDALAADLGQLQATLNGLNVLQEGLSNLSEKLSGLADPAREENAAVLANGRIEAASGLAQAESALPLLSAALEQAIRVAEQEFSTQQAEIDAGWQALQDSYDQLVAAQQLLDANAATISAGQTELAQGQAELNQRRADALAQLADARATLEDGLAQIADGQAEIDDGRATLAEERQNAADQIADARQQVSEVENATWYVQDRSGLGSFSSVDSDASSIEAIARIIPVIFYVVAILVSLTTATRMVDEERGLIGLYKALGYSKARILSKYLVYTVSAALIGGIIGDIAGFVLIPYILYYIFQAMYLLPLFSLNFSAFYAALGILAFVVGIGGSTFLSCRADLRETPATLMRPKAPRAGSRIFLEHIGPIWRRMGFLNKVTARNLFRYKKRLAMTVFGIMGCTALLICGFAIKNTVESLAPRQYEQIYRYDLMAATTTGDYASCLAELEDAPEVTSIQPIGVDTITVEYAGAKESMQLYVIPRGASITDYVSLEELGGAAIDLEEAGAVITNNAATVLGLVEGDTARITTSALDEADVALTAITRNYLGNAVYLTEDAYEELFGPLEFNGFFCHLSGTNDEQAAFADTLDGEEQWLSITSVAKMHEQFEQSFTLINVVVYVVIALAAGLAFVVLFTLSTVNIGEREREIATIKVLGFRKREVRTYINKETLVLTLLGILVGLPAGWALSESFTVILKMPSIYFDVVVDPWCYALAAAFSTVFAIAVSRICNRMLDRVVMVEALKSAE